MTKAMIIIFFKVIWHSLRYHKRFIVPMRFLEDIRFISQDRLIIIFCDKCHAAITVKYRIKEEATEYDMYHRTVNWEIPSRNFKEMYK